MRENRLSGLMRGGEFRGALTTAVGLSFMRELSAYSTQKFRAEEVMKLTTKTRRHRDRNGQRSLSPDFSLGLCVSVVHLIRAHRDFPPVISCNRAAISGATVPPGRRIQCVFKNCSGTSAPFSGVSSMQTGKMKRAPAAMGWGRYRRPGGFVSRSARARGAAKPWGDFCFYRRGRRTSVAGC